MLAAVGGYIYWHDIKNYVVKNAIQSRLYEKTDSLYFIRYDSSEIDEINGNATFYNVQLQSDTLQKELLESTASLPNFLFNIHVKEVGIRGVNIPGLLSNQTVSARLIYLKEPVLTIISTGQGKLNKLSTADTLALYKKMLGNFNSIRADTIEVIGGSVFITNKSDSVITSLKKIDIGLNNFVVDSTHNYTNIISYFITNIKVSVAEVKLPSDKFSNTIDLSNVMYDAGNRVLNINHIQQYNDSDKNLSIDINKINIDSLNTDAFIVQHRIQAGNFTCEGGLMTILLKKKIDKKKVNSAIEFSDSLFNQAQLSSITINNTKVAFINTASPLLKPFIVDSVRFEVFNRVKVSDGSTISDLVNNAHWKLSANGFSFVTQSGFYKVIIGPFAVENINVPKITVSNISIKPMYSEDEFGRLMARQHDLYNFDFNNIVLSGVNVKKLISGDTAEIESLSVQPLLRIFNDRTLPNKDSSSKIGTYPHQALFKIDFPFYIKNVKVSNGFVSYRERSSSSALVGNIFFTQLNGSISNLTNISEKVKQKPLCVLKVHALFLDTDFFSTTWVFPLDTKNGSFNIAGNLRLPNPINAAGLNNIIEPLGMMSINDGYIDKVAFNVDGNDFRTITNLELLYHNLNMSILKKDKSDNLKKKDLASFIANMIIRRNNPDGNQTRNVTGEIYQRDIHTAFFGLVWTSIFSSAKKIVMGKKAH